MATLKDVQDSISKFVSEARFCAENRKGFAAMSTIFNVVLAVTEAVERTKTKKKKSDKELFDAFVAELPDKDSWLATHDGKAPSNQVVSEILTETRNGIAHQLSLPTHKKGADKFKKVVLVNAIGDAPGAFQEWPDALYVVSTTDFVDVVEATVKKLSKVHKTASFDPFKQQWQVEREPATGSTTTTFLSSGSSPKT